MALDLAQAKFTGPAFPEPFVKFDLEKELNKAGVLLKETGEEGQKLKKFWDFYRRKLFELGLNSGKIRVRNFVIDNIVEMLGFSESVESDNILTRENKSEGEDGGWLLRTPDQKSQLRFWTVPAGTDLDTPIKRGYAYRFSFIKIAQRVLLAAGERIGIITDGMELRIIIVEPSKNDSQIIINIDTDWKRSYHNVPDTFRLLAALCSPAGIKLLPELLDKARLKQSTITKELRVQARQSIESFINDIVADNRNGEFLSKYQDRNDLARKLWHEGLTIVYKLLFILKGEASDDPARSFNFTGSTLWRNTYSPTVALAYYVRKVIDDKADTGNFLESGLKSIFKIFREGVRSAELNIKPLGGMLFDNRSMPILAELHWPEQACAKLLDKLLWTVPKGKGANSEARQRIHYGSLDIEDLGRIYEALLELDAGIASEPMCRLRRAKLEVVVPAAQGEKYKIVKKTKNSDEDELNEDEEVEIEETEESEEESSSKKGKTKIEWIEEIAKDMFYLRVGLGRKATGSYYTPHSFVKFLVQETLGPKIEEVSPPENPYPNEILKIKVLDPAMGSAHFLVEACRFMGEKLYEACRLCDEKVSELRKKIENCKNDEKSEKALREAMELYRERIIEIPDPNDEILNYLPDSAPEEWRSGYSQSKAIALCKRLVAVHCLYGVDKNPLAVELAKLSIWLESQSEGLPLTFLDHRFVTADSITGPFFEHLLKSPITNEPLNALFTDGLNNGLEETLKKALTEVRELEKSIGVDISEIENKKKSKEKMEETMLPFKILAAAWTGGVMLGREGCDETEYEKLAKYIADNRKLPDKIDSRKLLNMISRGLGIDEELSNIHEILSIVKAGNNIPSLSYDLTFPEVFFDASNGSGEIKKKGFDVVLGNPPWDRIEVDPIEYYGNIDFSVIEATTSEEQQKVIERLNQIKSIENGLNKISYQFENFDRVQQIQFYHQQVEVNGKLTLGRPDTYRLFVERWLQFASDSGLTGWLVPSSFHSNEGATGVRKYYLDKTRIISCFSFENKKKLFDIHSSFKFVTLVAKLDDNGTNTFNAGFYLHDDEILFDWKKNQNLITLSREIINEISGSHESFPEVRTNFDLKLSRTLAKSKHSSWGDWLLTNNIVTAFGVELHRNKDFNVPIPNIQYTSKIFLWAKSDGWNWLPIHAGKTIFQYTDSYDSHPETMVNAKIASSTRHWRKSVLNYRLAFRMKAASTNLRSMIAVMITPGFVCEQTLAVETKPLERPNSKSLLALGLSNSFMFDWLTRQRITTSLSNYLLATIPLPNLFYITKFVAHHSLRLSCNHSGYEPLWREQLGGEWREPNKKPYTWPVLETESERWEVRSAIDAVVANAYGLDRDQYEHILKSFDRASGPNPYTGICLEKFDELKKIGIDKFTKKYDPYHDVPLNENLPKPVIELPEMEENIKEEKSGTDGFTGDLFGNTVEEEKPKRKRKSK